MKKQIADFVSHNSQNEECELFVIEYLYDAESCDWRIVGDGFQNNIPVNIRRNHDGYGSGPMHKQPFADFTVGGECWQQTGIIGTFNESNAFDMAELLMRYNPGQTFQVTKLVISQKRTVLATFWKQE